ncbi:MAG: ATP-binding protein [Solirubrobacteraceae bacterium]
MADARLAGAFSASRAISTLRQPLAIVRNRIYATGRCINASRAPTSWLASATPILERAEELLPQLTADSLTRLFVDDEDGDHPVLMARRDNGGELGVNGMSDGALDQLYLALRLAALEHHLDALPPLPVLMDDILVNFDEQRVATTVPALAEIAQRTQVVVLTHHQHVATIAQDTLGDRVRVHRLETVSVA